MMSQHQHYLLQQIAQGSHNTNQYSCNYQHHNTLYPQTQQMPGSSHNGMLSKQNTLSGVLISPQSPNDVYGFQQKAMLS